MRRTITRLTISLALSLTVGVPGAWAARTTAGVEAIGADPVAAGLAFPAAFTFAPGGSIFYGERFTGEIRVIPPGGGDALFFTVNKLVTDGERGLLGLALHPDYPRQPYVYAYATRNVGGSIKNQILRITDTGGGIPVGCCKKIIFSSDTVSGSYHDGGRILFGPNGKLHAIVGDAHNPANAQNPSTDAGKILQMNANGGKKRIFAYGIRNSYGFTFDPTNGRLWETENGPTCNDEVNLVTRDGNYGWGPSQTCGTPPPPPLNTNQDGPDPQLPERFFTPPIAPTGTAFCVGCGLAASEGTLFFGAWNTGNIHRAVLTLDRMGIASQSVVYTHGGGILSMERGPGGALYFSAADGIYQLVEV